MKLLLDTHIFLWLNSEPDKIPPAAYDACCDSQNQLYLSYVSPWEIQIKQQLGRLQLKAALPDLIETQARENDLNMLSIELSHIYALQYLPYHHNDPFDRLLIAQSKMSQWYWSRLTGRSVSMILTSFQADAPQLLELLGITVKAG